MLNRKNYQLYIFIIILHFMICNTLAQEVNKSTPASEISSVTTGSSVDTTQVANSTSNTSDSNLLPISGRTVTNNTSPAANSVPQNGNATTEAKTENSTESPISETSPLPVPPSNITSIFFVNDLLYDMFPVRSDNGNICDALDNVTQCIGGVGRLKTFIKSKMKNNPNSLWVDAGNSLGGQWFKILKYKTALEAIKFLNYTFMTVGPDVYQYGQDANKEFLGELNSKIVVSNIDNPSVMKSGKYSFGSCNISVIGFVDNTTFVNGLTVKNRTEAIAQEINESRSEQNNFSHVITIVLGSTTRENANIIATTVPGIDILLHSGNCAPKETEDETTKYLCMDRVNQTDNSTTYVYSLGMNQSDMAARFLVGELQLTLKDNCNIDNVEAKHYDYSNETDDPWTANLTQIARFADLDKKLTENTKNLSGESQRCSHAECSLGDLIADSMLAALGQDMWSQNSARIAVFPAAILQNNKTLPKDNITATKLYNLVLVDAYLYTVPLTGIQLNEMLTISLNSNHETNTTDFLHVSNLLDVKYNRTNSNILSIISINTILNMSDSMNLQAINLMDNKTEYNAIIPYTLFQMDSYKKLLGAVNNSRILFHDVTVLEAVIRVINNTGFLALPIVGNRQQELEPVTEEELNCPSSTGTTILVTLVVTAVLIGSCYALWWYVCRRRRERSSSTLAMMNLDYGI